MSRHIPPQLRGRKETRIALYAFGNYGRTNTPVKEEGVPSTCVVKRASVASSIGPINESRALRTNIPTKNC